MTKAGEAVASAAAAVNARDVAITHAEAAATSASNAANYAQASQPLTGRDATDGYAGLTGYNINMKNALGTVISLLTNANAAARTYTLPDRSMTVAGTDDLTPINAAIALKMDASARDAVNGVAGLDTSFRVRLKNVAGTIASFFTNTNTAPRTYTLPNKDGTVAMTSDITGVNSGTNTGDETTATIKTKLGIATLSGANTGDETSATITTKLGFTPANAALIGVANGIVPLGADAKIAATYLPSYVDDVQEYASTAAFPATGEAGKIYLSTNTTPAKQWRWSGSAYQELTPSPGTTDAVVEGATNLYYTESRVRSILLTGLNLVTGAAVTAADSLLAALAKFQVQINNLSTSKANLAGAAFTGAISSTSSVSAQGTGGFISTNYAVGVRNPIWRFGDADQHGMSYFQGSAGLNGADSIGFHFGSATAAGSKFSFAVAGMTATVPITATNFIGPGTGLTGTAASLIAGRASTLAQGGGAGAAMTFNWSGNVGGNQPPWLWGGFDGQNHYVYTPSNFSVLNSANLGNITAARTMQKRNHAYNNGGPSLDTITQAEYGFAYSGQGNNSGPFMHFGGLNTDGNYAAQFSLTYAGELNFKVRTQNSDVAGGPWNPWREMWHTGNLAAPSVPASANTLVQRTVNGYIEGSYLHMTEEGLNGQPGTVTGIICKRGDHYYRITNAASVKAYLQISGQDVYSVRENMASYVGVSREMAWKHYGTSHTIIDASAATSPAGGAIDRANAANRWVATFPTLVGWNGSSTYGVRVDSCRAADNATRLYASDAPYNIDGTNPYFMSMVYNGKWRLSVTPGTPADVSVQHATVADTATTANALSGTALAAGNLWAGGQSFNGGGSIAQTSPISTLQPYSTGGGAAGMSFHRAGHYGLNFGLDSDNVIRIGGWSRGNAHIFHLDMDGNLTVAGNVTAYSDERLKINWRPLGTDFVERWAKVTHGIYDRTDSGERQVGLGAQSVRRILPDAVATQADGYLSLNYGAAAAVATVALAQKVVELEALVKSLAARLDTK
ncbi:MAG: tail fiber domain-containing protein [Telluria sp.]